MNQKYTVSVAPLAFLCVFSMVVSQVHGNSILQSMISSSNRNCFTQYSDFTPGSLEGEWSGISEEEWEIEAKAGRRQRYGNMSCIYEEESKACGRQVGMWENIMKKPGAPELLKDNQAYSLNHMVLKPYRCNLEQFDAKKLLSLLSKGDRTLHIKGDSTMRQMFNALQCSIPTEYTLPDEVHDRSFAKQKGCSQYLKLKGGGTITLEAFPDGENLFDYGFNKQRKFDPEHFAFNLFGSCPKGDICINRPTLHRQADGPEVLAFHNEEFHQVLRRNYSQPNHEIGWSIVLAPSVQHFPNKGQGFSEQDIARSEEAHALAGRDDQCDDSSSQIGTGGQYFEGAQHVGEEVSHEACLPEVCAPGRDLALSSLLKLKLPLAILNGEIQNKNGRSHILRPPLTILKRDCTHWCAPGMSDAVLSTVLTLVHIYDGNHTKFAEKMMATAFV